MNKFYNWAKGNTTKEDIENAIEKHLDVRNQIYLEMETDYDAKSSALLSDYLMANDDERAIMDVVLADICGWTMGSIIKRAERDGNIDEEYENFNDDDE